MDTEQLKLLLELLQGAGEGAKDIAILYLLTQIVPYFVFAGVFLISLFVIVRAMQKHARQIERDTVAWESVSSAAVGYPIPLPNAKDIQRVVTALREQGASRVQ
jgi:sirohydrochlorin ferrochelatase